MWSSYKYLVAVPAWISVMVQNHLLSNYSTILRPDNLPKLKPFLIDQDNVPLLFIYLPQDTTRNILRKPSFLPSFVFCIKLSLSLALSMSQSRWPPVLGVNITPDVISPMEAWLHRGLRREREVDIAAQVVINVITRDGHTSPMEAWLNMTGLEEVCYEGGDAKEQCSICLEEFVVGSSVARLPCSHVYHFSCVSRWLEMKDDCPLCRTVLPSSVSPYLRFQTELPRSWFIHCRTMLDNQLI